MTEWDPPGDDTPMPYGARKKYEAEKKRKRIVKWGGISIAVVIAAVAVAIGFTRWKF